MALNVPELRFPEFSGEWEEKQFGNICQIKKSKYNPENEKESLKCIELEHLSQNTGKILGYCDSKGQNSVKNRFEKGDVLFGKLRPYLRKYWLAKFDGVCSSEIWVFDGKEILNDFLFQLIQTNKFNYISNISSGSKMPRSDWKYMKHVKFKIPSNREQEKIASFLSKVDKKIEKLEKKQELWETYKKGMMQKIFSQELRFKDENGEEYPDWEEKRFEEIMEYGKAGGTPTSTNKNFYGGSIPFLSIADMTSQGKFVNYTEKYLTKEGLKSSSAWLVPKNSLIYSIYASVGSVAINKSDISTSQAIFGIILKEKTIKLDYVYYYLLDYQKYIHKFIETGTQGNLNAKTVRSLIIKLPKIGEQAKISYLLSSIDKKIDQLEKELDFNKEFKKGLLQQMFC